MELDEIKDLMQALEDLGLTRLKVKRDNFELELEKSAPEVHSTFQPAPPQVGIAPVFETKSETTPVVNNVPQEAAEEAACDFVLAPMVGTFYSAPAPDEPAFIKVGDAVTEDSVICIIEAMKVMNEVKAGMNGTLAEVLVEDGHPIEFGTKLFKIV